MSIDKRKLYISFGLAVLLLIAISWLVLRGCSGLARKANSVYYIGRDSTWNPVDLRGREKAMVGFTNDLISAIASKMGFKVVIFEVGQYALFDGLNFGNYDAVLSSLTPDVINRRQYGFSDPFYLVGPVLVVRENSKITNLQDMEGKILGVESRAFQTFDIEEPADVVIIPYATGALALENLNDNVIDGVVLDALRAHVWTGGFYSGRLRIVTSPLTDRGLRVVTLNTAENLEWLEQFNEGLKQTKESGLYEELLVKWDLIDTTIRGAVPVPL